MISLLCPSRGRPELAKRLVDSALATAKTDIEILLYLNEDDPCLEEYQRLIDPKYIEIGPDRSPAYSWNLLADQAKHDIFFLLGDDVEFITQDWDQLTINHFNKFKDKLACIYPLHTTGKRHKNPHFCVHRNWKDILGYFVPPQFWHWYVDTWTREVAQKIDRYVLMEDVVLNMEKDIDDDTTKRVHVSSLRERDHYLWKTTQRWLEADAQTLKQHLKRGKK